MCTFIATDKDIQFEKLEVYRDKTLGRGSYGEVFHAKCDYLPCAAKVIQARKPDSIHFHQKEPDQNSSITSSGGEEMSVQRFLRECEILKRMRHPCIVQYLGTGKDPDSGHVAMLMELASQNLTSMLRLSSGLPQNPLPMKLQLQFNRDVALAIAYLHQNGVIHRDISSNNVLVVGRSKLKVGDFGMAAVIDKDSSGRLSDPLPGTEAYMAPEASPVHPSSPVSYSFKLDCFSFGVLSLQIATRKFPKPSSATKRRKVAEEQVSSEDRKSAQVQQIFTWTRVPEVERRTSHIKLIDSSHPILSLALGCLMDDETARPSANQICQELDHIIKSSQEKFEGDYGGESYEHSSLASSISSTSSSDNSLSTIECSANREEFRSIPANKNRGEYESSCRSSPFSSSLYVDISMPPMDKGTKWTLQWKKQEETIKAGQRLQRGNCTTHGNTVFVIYNRTISSFKSDPGSSWETLCTNAYLHSSLVMLHGSLTTVGGKRNHKSRRTSNLLRSLLIEEQGQTWEVHFPPMPTKRSNACTVQFDGGLVVAGGTTTEASHNTNGVEILNLRTLVWARASSLPCGLSQGSMVLSGHLLYVLGEQSVYQCSIGSLIDSCQTVSLRKRILKKCTVLKGFTPPPSTKVWSYCSHCPLHHSTLVTLCGELVAIGGMDRRRHARTSIYKYDTWTERWEEVCHMGAARYRCLAGVTTGDTKLIVVGGCDADHTPSNTIEIANVQDLS